MICPLPRVHRWNSVAHSIEWPIAVRQQSSQQGVVLETNDIATMDGQALIWDRRTSKLHDDLIRDALFDVNLAVDIARAGRSRRRRVGQARRYADARRVQRSLRREAAELVEKDLDMTPVCQHKVNTFFTCFTAERRYERLCVVGKLTEAA